MRMMLTPVSASPASRAAGTGPAAHIACSVGSAKSGVPKKAMREKRSIGRDGNSGRTDADRRRIGADWSRTRGGLEVGDATVVRAAVRRWAARDTARAEWE